MQRNINENLREGFKFNLSELVQRAWVELYVLSATVGEKVDVFYSAVRSQETVK